MAMASSRLLSLTILSGLCLGAYIPQSGVSRPLDSPGTDSPDFIDNVLTSVNHYRAEQGASDLSWSSELATEAEERAKQCGFSQAVSISVQLNA